MSSISALTEQVIRFRDEREWKQFHNPKDVALSLVLEAGEVMEHFQWKNAEEVSQHIDGHKDEIGDELSDVLYWVLLMAHDLDIDLVTALERKLAKNANKYPIEKSKGSNKKYTKLK